MSTEQIKDKFPNSGDFLQTVFEISLQPMYVYDLETMKFLSVNNAAVEQYGYTREEFLSMNIKEIRPLEEVSRLVNMISQLGLGVQHLGFWTHRRKDGSLMDVEISSHGINFEGRKARLVIAQDVTERKRAIDALRKSEEKYRDLFEHANDAIFIVSVDLRYLDVNKKAVEILGYSKEELLSMKITDLIPPEQIPRSVAEYEKLKVHGSYKIFVGKVRTKDGRWLDVEVSSSAIIENGTIIGSRDIMRDITDRKKMEGEKEKIFNELKQAHDKVNQLSGILPICSYCKKIRDDKGYWKQIELYVRDHSEAEFSHGMCPECAKKVYKEFEEFKKSTK
ncbi:MAG: PAS domain S-box protein [Nitrospirota bacterium]